MPSKTRKNRKPIMHIKDYNSGYNGDKSNSSDSNANANNNTSVRGIPNKTKRRLKNYRSNILKTRNYTNKNAHLIASISSHYNSYPDALNELYKVGNDYKISQTHMQILEYKLGKIYNSY